MISSSIPFPPVSWWIKAYQAQQVYLDVHEHYQKMSYRNRYYLASPEGKMLMSIPLENGRNQRVPVKEVKISNKYNWQDNHWKTITSLYGRSPFFEYFEYRVKPLFEQQYEWLHDFNKASINLVGEILRPGIVFFETKDFQKNYPEYTTDMREQLTPQQANDTKEYYQVFAERSGFQQDCSILDLLFCEGMYATEILKQGDGQ